MNRRSGTESSLIGAHTARQYTAELEDVRHHVLSMGGLVEQQVTQSILALTRGDSALARQVIDDEDRVDAHEVRIDERCARILARRQPAAGDLRLLITVIKVITDLERMGDEAEKIARVARSMGGEPCNPRQGMELETLGERVRGMLREGLDAFARMDGEAAVRVVQADVAVDRDYHELADALVRDMEARPEGIREDLALLSVLRALERVADHICNICEYVVFVVRGKDVRHLDVASMADSLRRGP